MLLAMGGWMVRGMGLRNGRMGGFKEWVDRWAEREVKPKVL
jgi:hypothetical protein